MGSVTIRGTTQPSAELPRGETRTVQHTPHVQRLIDRGYVEVFDPSSVRRSASAEDPPAAVGLSAAATEPTAPASAAAAGETAAPAHNASKDAWRAFLDSRDVPYRSDAGRDDLIATWNDYSEDHDR